MDATAAAYTLRRLRERRGWSWSDLARALASAARDLGIARVAAASQASIRRTHPAPRHRNRGHHRQPSTRPAAPSGPPSTQAVGRRGIHRRGGRPPLHRPAELTARSAHARPSPRFRVVVTVLLCGGPVWL